MAWTSVLTMSATQAMGGKLINLTATEVAFVGLTKWGTKSKIYTAMRSSSLDKRSPSDDTGMALSQAPDSFELAAI